VKDGDEEILPCSSNCFPVKKMTAWHTSKLFNKNKLEYYLDEYVVRYNIRTSTIRGLLFR